MADVKISELADVVGVSVAKLLSQIKEAGLTHTKASELISNEDRNTLLVFLRRSHGDQEATDASPKKITLKRKTIGTLKAASTHGRGKTVNVEVRKKRTYVKRSTIADEEPTAEQETPVAPAELEEEKALDIAADTVAAEDSATAKETSDKTTEDKSIEVSPVKSADPPTKNIPFLYNSSITAPQTFRVASLSKRGCYKAS